MDMAECNKEQVKKTAKEYHDFYESDESQIIFEQNKILATTPMLSDIERFWLDLRKEARQLLGHNKPKVKKELSIYDDGNWIVHDESRITNKHYKNPHDLTRDGLWEGNRQVDEGFANWHNKVMK